ncbi:histidine kinase, partial [Bacillus subtilis]|nr:histidine kinase [Bacillus subtilis]
LHKIAGLIQLGKSEKAFQLAFQASTVQENVTEFLHRSIQNVAAAGLLLSKIRRGSELGIAVHIDENSCLQQFPEHVD